MEYMAWYPSPMGPILLASDGEALTGLWMEGQRSLEKELGMNDQMKDLPVFRETAAWLDAYFAPWPQGSKEPAKKLQERPKLAPKGTEFQQRVWKLLLEIPYGEVTSYGALAKQVAKEMGKERMSAQAVGGAVGRNPISILIPCHRVVGSDGSMTGYAGGIDKKITLLGLEGIDV